MTRARTSRLGTTSAFILALFSACTPDRLVTPASDRALAARIQAGDPNAVNNPGFHWLPPIGTSGGSKAPDASLLSRMTIVVCDWNGSVCGATATTIRAGSTQGYLSVDGGHYQANLDAKKYLASGHVYRARVFVLSTEVGHLDLQVVDNGSQAKSVAAPQIAVVKNSTLPLKFTIDQSSIVIASPTEGGTVSSGDGGVRLTIPPGALSEETAITIVPVNGPLPGDHVPVPALDRLAVDLEPSGTTFAVPATITLAYDPATIPSDLPQELLRLYTYRPDVGYWEDVPSVIDIDAHTLTGSVSHFSDLTMMGARVQGPFEAGPIICPNPAGNVVFRVPATGVLGKSDIISLYAPGVVPLGNVTVTMTCLPAGGPMVPLYGPGQLSRPGAFDPRYELKTSIPQISPPFLPTVLTPDEILPLKVLAVNKQTGETVDVTSAAAGTVYQGGVFSTVTVSRDGVLTASDQLRNGDSGSLYVMYEGALAQMLLSTVADRTTVTVADQTVQYHQPFVVSAKVFAVGAGNSVSFSISGLFGGNALTLSGGFANFSVPPWPFQPGSYPISARFLGNSRFPAATGFGTLTVTRGRSGVLALLSVPSPAYGASIQLLGDLREEFNGPQFIAGAKLDFSIDGVSVGSAATLFNGQPFSASIPYVANFSRGKHTLSVAFAGNPLYEPGTASVDFQAPGANPSITVAAVTAVAGQPATLSATMLPSTAGQTLRFSVDGAVVGSSPANSSGVASLTYGAPLSVGTHTLTVSFAGDAIFNPATGSGTLTVTAPACVATGLVGRWNLDGNGLDAGPNGLNGSLSGPVPATDRNGVAGGALGFAPISGVFIPDSPLLRFSGDFTLSFWMKRDALTGNPVVLLTKGNDQHNVYTLNTDFGADVVNFIVRNESFDLMQVGAPVPIGAWHNVTGVVSNSTLTMSLYVDGVLASQDAMPHAFQATVANPLVLGRQEAPSSEYPFTGLLDDVRVYNRALTSCEIGTIAR